MGTAERISMDIWSNYSGQAHRAVVLLAFSHYKTPLHRWLGAGFFPSVLKLIFLILMIEYNYRMLNKGVFMATQANHDPIMSTDALPPWCLQQIIDLTCLQCEIMKLVECDEKMCENFASNSLIAKAKRILYRCKSESDQNINIFNLTEIQSYFCNFLCCFKYSVTWKVYYPVFREKPLTNPSPVCFLLTSNTISLIKADNIFDLTTYIYET